MKISEEGDAWESLTTLDEHSWEVLTGLSAIQGTCILDLSQIETVTPAGVVALLLFAKGRMTQDGRRRPTRIETPPARSQAFKRLEQIDLLYLLRYFSQVRFVNLNRYNPAPPTPKLSNHTKTLIAGSPQRDTTHDLMRRYLEHAYPERADRLKGVFSELLNNINDHAGNQQDMPFHCIQMQTTSGGLELAFGDLGVGFRASLARNPENPAYTDESSALRAAIIESRSGKGHENPDRGGGLTRALEAVSDLGGCFRVLSRDGLATSQDPESPSFDPLPEVFPATMVWVRLPLTAQV